METKEHKETFQGATVKLERLMLKLGSLKRSEKRKLLKTQVDVILGYKIKHSVKHWIYEMEARHCGAGGYS